MLREDFKYNGKKLSDFQMKMYDPEEKPSMPNRTVEKSNINFSRQIPNHYGAYFSDVKPHHIRIIKNPDYCKSQNELRLTDKEIDQIKSWLFSPTTPTEFIATRDDEETDVIYYGLFTEIQYFIVGEECHGLDLTFECNAPYGFSPYVSKRYVISSGSVNGDYLNNAAQFSEMVPPVIIIRSANSGFNNEELTIRNNTDNNQAMKIKLPTGIKQITIDCQKRMASGIKTDGTEELLRLSDLGVVFEDNIENLRRPVEAYSLYWLKLLRGNNKLNFTTTNSDNEGVFNGRYTVEVRTRYIIKAGGF